MSGSPRPPQGRIPGASNLILKTTCQCLADFSPKALSLHSVLSNYITLGRSPLNCVLSRRNSCPHKCISTVLCLSRLRTPERSRFDLTMNPLPSLFFFFFARLLAFSFVFYQTNPCASFLMSNSPKDLVRIQQQAPPPHCPPQPSRPGRDLLVLFISPVTHLRILKDYVHPPHFSI